MAIPTREEIITFAQELLGDPNGEIFTTAVLSNPFEAAFREMYAAFDKNQIPRAKQTVYTNLSSYTSLLTPAQAGIADFGEIIELAERNISNTKTITGATSTSPIDLTVSAHGISSNTEVITSGVTGQIGANGRFWVTAKDANTLTLRGSTHVAAYVSGGTLTISTDKFTSVDQLDSLPQRDISDHLGTYVWEQDTFLFVGATVDRQLRIIYYSSGAAPATGSVGVDDSKNFLANRTGAIAGPTKQWGIKLVADLRAQAAQYLFDLIQPQVRVGQRDPIRPRAYRTGMVSRITSQPVYVAAPPPATPYDETPMGTVDGVNTVFTLSYTPRTSGLDVKKNGVSLTLGVDFTLSANAITFTVAPAIASVLRAIYYV